MWGSDGIAARATGASPPLVWAVPSVFRMVGATSSNGDLVVVVAHSLLTPVWGCEVAAKTLLERGDRLSVEVREELLQHIVSRATFTAEMLADLIRGGAAHVVEALEGLGASDR